MTTETRIPAPEKHWYVIHTYSGYENKVKAMFAFTGRKL